MKFLIICSSQRTGSTLIGEFLRAAGLATGCEEFFEPAYVMPQSVLPALGIASVTDVERDVDGYVERIKKHWGDGDRFLTIKIHRHQLDHWAPHGLDLERHFQGARYMVCNRGDFLKQAISAVKANQTESWSHGQKARRAPVYSFEGLHTQLQIMIREQQEWEAYFSARKIRPYRLAYETLDQDYRGTVRNVSAWLGRPLSRWQLMRLRPSLKRQRDRLNEEWEARYCADLGKER